MPKSRLVFAVLLCTGAAAAAHAGVGGEYFIASIAYSGTEPMNLLCTPDGSGDAFTEARLASGQIVDATLTLTAYDGGDLPLVGLPAEDLWLQPENGGLVPCGGRAIADAPTDADGVTRWQRPLHAGGWDAGPTRIVGSIGFSASQPFAISFNSADSDGDGGVDLADIGRFAIDYYGEYHLRSDLSFDQQLNLSDVGKLVLAVGVHCQ